MKTLDKHLYPWTIKHWLGGHPIEFVRKSFGGGSYGIAFVYWQSDKGNWLFVIEERSSPKFAIYSPYSLSSFFTHQNAMHKCDEVLIQKGYYLIGEDEAEKFERLELLI